MCLVPECLQTSHSTKKNICCIHDLTGSFFCMQNDESYSLESLRRDLMLMVTNAMVRLTLYPSFADKAAAQVFCCCYESC
jgi:hypothetical protein